MTGNKKPWREEAKKKIYDKPEDTYSIWGDPKEWFDSQWRRVSYQQWCEKERDRLAKKEKFVEIVTAEDGEIALREIGL